MGGGFNRSGNHAHRSQHGPELFGAVRATVNLNTLRFWYPTAHPHEGQLVPVNTMLGAGAAGAVLGGEAVASADGRGTGGACLGQVSFCVGSLPRIDEARTQTSVPA